VTTPAAETESIGLPADAQLSWFLHRHLDSFIVTGQLRSIYRDFCKNHASPDTDGNFPYHRAGMVIKAFFREINKKSDILIFCLNFFYKFDQLHF
jgi:hypothetical protein